MTSILKHIIRLTLFLFMAGTIASCQSWHEAKEVIAEADSLLVEGAIMRDTVALARAIEALDKPFNRMLAREELAEAYYLMGRNLDDYHHNFAEAADYYIAADRIKTKDYVMRGLLKRGMFFLKQKYARFTSYKNN